MIRKMRLCAAFFLYLDEKTSCVICENGVYFLIQKIMKLLLLFNILNSFKIMDKDEIKSRLLGIIAQRVNKQLSQDWKDSERLKNLKASDECVTMDSNFCDDLCMDSLDRIELAMDIEKSFSLPRLDDTKVEKWKIVSDSYQTICEVLKVA